MPPPLSVVGGRPSGTALDLASGEKPLSMDDALLDEERFECVCRPPPSLLLLRVGRAERVVEHCDAALKIGEEGSAKQTDRPHEGVSFLITRVR